jgi:hypothetical protein
VFGLASVLYPAFFMCGAVQAGVERVALTADLALEVDAPAGWTVSSDPTSIKIIADDKSGAFELDVWNGAEGVSLPDLAATIITAAHAQDTGPVEEATLGGVKGLAYSFRLQSGADVFSDRLTLVRTSAAQCVSEFDFRRPGITPAQTQVIEQLVASVRIVALR